MLFKSHPNSAVGIDIGTTTIKLAQLANIGKGKIKLTNYAILETLGHMDHFNNAIQSSNLKPLNSDIVSYLAAIKKKLNIKSSTPVVASLPTFSAFTTLLELPEMNNREMTKSLSAQVEKYIPTPITAVSLDWIKVGEKKFKDGKKSQEILIISIPNEKIRAYQEIFSDSGFNLRAFEIENKSLARSLTRNREKPTLIIDIGGRSTSFAVGQRGKLQFVGQTDFSSGSLTQALSTGLNISLKRADTLKHKTNIDSGGGGLQLSTILRPIIDVIINEATRIKDSFEQIYGIKIEEIILTGGGANMPGFAKYLNSKTNIQVTLGNALQGIAYPPELEAVAPELKTSLAVSVGLALQQLI